MTTYWEQGGIVIKDDGREEWCIYNPELRDWERTPRAKFAYDKAFQDPFYRISEKRALEAIKERQKVHDEIFGMTSKPDPGNAGMAWPGKNF